MWGRGWQRGGGWGVGGGRGGWWVEGREEGESPGCQGPNGEKREEGEKGRKRDAKREKGGGQRRARGTFRFRRTMRARTVGCRLSRRVRSCSASTVRKGCVQSATGWA